MIEDLFDSQLSYPTYKADGPEYDPRLDENRLSKQMGRVYQLMIDGVFRTLQEISIATGDPQASISAQLRHLRKKRFGSYIVNRHRRGDRDSGLFEYQLQPHSEQREGK